MANRLTRKLGFVVVAGVVSLLMTLVHYGCAAHRYEVKTPPDKPFQAVIVPGCPSKKDGSLSACQARRAIWAAIQWERGHAEHFITSGAAVHSPFVEAEALAAAMTALGVPAERIYVEKDALHTDENVYNALQIARRLGFSRLAIASDRGQAVGACQMLADWHPQCGAFSMDYRLVDARRAAVAAELERIRTRPVQSFVPLAEREQARAKKSGRPPRPPSFVLYPLMLLRKGLGRPPWQPFAPDDVSVRTWAEVLREP
jgi:hypothetical protein